MAWWNRLAVILAPSPTHVLKVQMSSLTETERKMSSTSAKLRSASLASLFVEGSVIVEYVIKQNLSMKSARSLLFKKN